MKYEFMGIVKPFLPEDVRLRLIKNIQKAFTDCGGKVMKKDTWGKRHLAYKIDGHEEGYYILYEVELNSENVDKIKEDLRMMKDLLRYMIIKNEEYRIKN